MTSQLFRVSNRRGPFSDRLRKLGYLLEETKVRGKLLVRITTSGGKKWIVGANVAYPMTSHEVYVISNNKMLSYEIAQKIGVNIASTVCEKSVNSAAAKELLANSGTVIVKPLDGYKSKGVSVDVSSDSQLEAAEEKALSHSSHYIVQQQIFAEEYRFTVIEGKVVSVLLREHPSVTGDGVSTVSQLIDIENESRKKLKTDYIKYPILSETNIDRSFLASEKILDKGEKLTLSKTSAVSEGASAYELIDEIHESYKDIAEKLVNELGSALLVVDIFLDCHTAEATKDNYWFNEFNAAPSLKMYHAARNKDVSYVADKIIELTDQYLKSYK